MTKVKCPWKLCKHNSADMSKSPQEDYGYCKRPEITLKGFSHAEIEYVECHDFEIDCDKCIVHTENINNDIKFIDINRIKK